jgi:hypothetical protein
MEDEGENEAANPEAQDVMIDWSIFEPESFGSDDQDLLAFLKT